jgi:hypothetical protein
MGRRVRAVAGRSRGPETIRLLNLNSKQLKESRQLAISDALGSVDLTGALSEDVGVLRRSLLARWREHIGAIRQALATRVLLDPATVAAPGAEL